MAVMEAKPTRNIARLAMEVGVSRQTLYTWLDEGCPVERGADAVREWRATHHPPPSSASELTKLARARLIDAQSYAQEQKNLERDGELWAAEDVRLAWRQAMGILRSRFEDMPESQSSDLPIEMRDANTERAREMLFLALRELEGTRLGD